MNTALAICTITLALWSAMTSSDLTRADIEHYYRQVVPKAFGTSDELRARCPIHNGSSNSSFSIDLKTGRWYCHSQCGRGGDVFGLQMQLHGLSFPEAHKAVYEILGRPAPPFQGSQAPKPLTEYRQKLSPWRTTATYVYEDESGNALFRAVRKEKLPVGNAKPEKRFSLETPRDGGWNSAAGNMEGVRRVPYRLPQLIEARNAGEWIWLVEGEKAAESLVKLGLPATCNPQGAGKWSKYRHDLNPPFAGARVVILPDNDDPGRRHAVTVADNLLSLAAAVKLLELPELPEKGDVVDWLATGGDREKLLRLAAATPQLDATLFATFKRQWTPAKPKSEFKQGNVLEMLAAGEEREPEPPATEAEEAIRKELKRLLQANVLRFIQIGLEEPSFCMETSRGSIWFENWGQVLTQRDFRRISGPILKHNIAYHKEPEWIAFCNMLLAITTIERADPEAEPTGSIKAWLVEYLQSSLIHESWEDALKADDPDSRRLPHFEGSRIWISAQHASQWCLKHRNENISYKRLAQILGHPGFKCERVQRSTRVPKTNITFYRLPEDFNSADYKIDLTATPANDSAYMDHA